MKKLLYILITVALLTGCSKIEQPVLSQTDVLLSFNVNVEDMTIVQTKVNGDELIENLNVLVFNEDGYFINRYAATINGDQFSIILPGTENKRIVHFVANYDWTTFSDTQHYLMSENELLLSISTDEKPAFWNRYVLNNGIQDGSLSYLITLLRNYAKFSLENKTIGQRYLQNVSFCIINARDKGTIAPFDPVRAMFAQGALTQHPESRLVNTKFATAEPIYTYENENDGESNPFIIIEADYIDKYSQISKKSFYKIEIQDQNGKKLEIIRNYHYIVKIKSVNGSGYNTLEEAQQGVASNNIEASVEIKDYTSVSNGVAMLSVSQAVIKLTKVNCQYSFNYKFIPNLENEIIDNSDTKIEVNNVTVNGAIDDGSLQVSTTDGKITFKTPNSITTNQVMESEIIISKNGLRKVVKVTLQEPAKFQNVIILADALDNIDGQKVGLKFALPLVDGIEFPVPIYITTNFNPDLNAESGKNLTLTTQDGLMKWIYMAQKEGDHIVDFMTTTSNVAHKMTLESPYYATTYIDVATSNFANEFVDVFVLRDGNKGENATLYFTIKNPRDGSIDVTIRTESMTYVSNPYNEKVTTIAGGYRGYIYHTSGWGNKMLRFTTQGNGQKEVTVEADGFKPVTVTIPKWSN